LEFRLKFAEVYEAQRLDPRFFRPFRADLSIRKSSSFFPPFLMAATSQRGLAPRPAQASPDGPRYFGGIFLPLNGLPPPRTTTLAPPTTASSLTAFQSRHDAQEAFRQLLREAGPPSVHHGGRWTALPPRDASAILRTTRDLT